MTAAEDYFSNIDSEGIAERHVEQVLRLEEQAAKNLLRRYRQVRQELRDRLDMLPEGTFTSTQLSGTLLQIERAIEAMNAALMDGMRDEGSALSNEGVRHLEAELRRYEREFRGAVVPLNLNAIQVTADVSNFKLNQYKASLDAYGSQLVRDMSLQLGNSVLQNRNVSQVVQDLGKFFQGEEWRLLRIARTELHSTYAMGKWEGMKQASQTAVPGLKKAVYTPMDHRTSEDSIYFMSLNQIKELDEPFEYTWNGKKRIFQFPPDRPNDRSTLIPAHDDWIS